MNSEPRYSKRGSVIQTADSCQLLIPASSKMEYRLAQLDDYSKLSRLKFPHHSLTLSLHARASSISIPGTWGFGVWNDPFGLSLGFGGNPFRLPALPNAAWFFHASPQNHLSFHDDKPAQGFLAQTFRSPNFHPLLFPAGLALPFSRKATRNFLGRIIEEDGVVLGINVTQWHEYRLEWCPKRVCFWVDNAQVLESSVNPNGPLGIVIWIDNQFAAFTPDGKISFGVLPGQEECLEIKNLEIKNSPE